MGLKNLMILIAILVFSICSLVVSATNFPTDEQVLKIGTLNR